MARDWTQFGLKKPACRRLVACFGLAVVVACIGGCRKPAAASIPTPSREEHLTSRQRFSRYCQGCHGEDGHSGPAPILNDPIFLAIIPQEVLVNTVANGRPAHLMPAWAKDQGGPLTREQIEELVQSIPEWWGNPNLDKSSLPRYAVTTTQRSGAAGDPAAGRTKFENVCGRCHGRDGRGKNAGALRSAAFLALASHQLIRRTMIVGRPDLGMPNFIKLGDSSSLQRPLTSQDISDILFHILSWPEAGVLGSGAATKEAVEP